MAGAAIPDVYAPPMPATTLGNMVKTFLQKILDITRTAIPQLMKTFTAVRLTERLGLLGRSGYTTLPIELTERPTGIIRPEAVAEAVWQPGAGAGQGDNGGERGRRRPKYEYG